MQKHVMLFYSARYKILVPITKNNHKREWKILKPKQVNSSGHNTSLQ